MYMLGIDEVQVRYGKCQASAVIAQPQVRICATLGFLSFMVSEN